MIPSLTSRRCAPSPRATRAPNPHSACSAGRRSSRLVSCMGPRPVSRLRHRRRRRGSAPRWAGRRPTTSPRVRRCAAPPRARIRAKSAPSRLWMLIHRCSLSHVRGVVGGLWRMKAPRARAPADADGRLLQWRKLENVRFSPLKTASKKLFPVKRTRGLRFAGPCRTAASGRRAFQVHGVSLICSARRASTEAHMLHAVTICYRTAAAATVLKDSSSFFTDHMLPPHALVEVLGGHRQSSR